VNTSVPTPTPLPLPKRRHHALHVKVILHWTWRYRTTWLKKVTIGRFPAHVRLTVRCQGRHCPDPATTTATGKRRVHRLVRSLWGHRYRVGDRLRIVLTAPGLRREAAVVIFRDGRLPTIRRL